MWRYNWQAKVKYGYNTKQGFWYIGKSYQVSDLRKWNSYSCVECTLNVIVALSAKIAPMSWCQFAVLRQILANINVIIYAVSTCYFLKSKCFAFVVNLFVWITKDIEYYHDNCNLLPIISIQFFLSGCYWHFPLYNIFFYL